MPALPTFSTAHATPIVAAYPPKTNDAAVDDALAIYVHIDTVLKSGDERLNGLYRSYQQVGETCGWIINQACEKHRITHAQVAALLIHGDTVQDIATKVDQDTFFHALSSYPASPWLNDLAAHLAHEDHPCKEHMVHVFQHPVSPATCAVATALIAQRRGPHIHSDPTDPSWVAHATANPAWWPLLEAVDPHNEPHDQSELQLRRILAAMERTLAGDSDQVRFISSERVLAVSTLLSHPDTAVRDRVLAAGVTLSAHGHAMGMALMTASLDGEADAHPMQDLHRFLIGQRTTPIDPARITTADHLDGIDAIPLSVMERMDHVIADAILRVPGHGWSSYTETLLRRSSVAHNAPLLRLLVDETHRNYGQWRDRSFTSAIGAICATGTPAQIADSLQVLDAMSVDNDTPHDIAGKACLSLLLALPRSSQGTRHPLIAQQIQRMMVVEAAEAREQAPRRYKRYALARSDARCADACTVTPWDPTFAAWVQEARADTTGRGDGVAMKGRGFTACAKRVFGIE
jgi:hypothetical protein